MQKGLILNKNQPFCYSGPPKMIKQGNGKKQSHFNAEFTRREAVGVYRLVIFITFVNEVYLPAFSYP
jgi:hypothetical protein